MLFNLQKPARSLTKEFVNVAKKNRRCMSAAALPNPITAPEIQVLKIEMDLGSHTSIRHTLSKLHPNIYYNTDIELFLFFFRILEFLSTMSSTTASPGRHSPPWTPPPGRRSARCRRGTRPTWRRPWPPPTEPSGQRAETEIEKV